MPNLDAALSYAARGWHVFPTHTCKNGACSCRKSDCRNPGKHPRTANGLGDATVDPDQIRAWWKQWPTANVAIRTGRISGLLVLDLDRKHGDPDAMIAAVDMLAGSDCPRTAVSLTGGGGKHLLFALADDPDGATATNSTGQLGKGVDVRGEGGYIVAPPSVHHSGSPYQWEDYGDEEWLPSIDPAPADWLLAAIAATRRSVSGADPRREASGPRQYLDEVPDWLPSALAVLSPDCGYEDWIAIGMALEQVPGGFDLFDTWSQRAPHRYGGTDAMRRAWRGIQGKVSKLRVGTIWERARQAGWAPPVRQPVPPPDDRFAPPVRAERARPALRVVDPGAVPSRDEVPPPDDRHTQADSAPPSWPGESQRGSEAQETVRRLDEWVATLAGLPSDALASEVTTGWAPGALAYLQSASSPAAHRILLTLVGILSKDQMRALKASVKAFAATAPAVAAPVATRQAAGHLFGPYYIRPAAHDRAAAVVRVVTKEDGDREVLVCSPPVEVTGVAMDVDNGEHFTTLRWEVAGREQVLDLPQDQTHTARLITGAAKHGLPVSSSTAGEVVDFLVAAEQAHVHRAGLLATTRRTGWHGSAAGRAFLRGAHTHGAADAPVLRVDRDHRSFFDAIGESGTMAGWVQAAGAALTECEPLRLYMAAAMVSPLLGVLGTLVEPFIVDMVSTTSQGKTTALRVVASAWGVPHVLQKEWHATWVAIDRLAGMSNGLPLFLNESQLGPRRTPDLYAQMIYGLTSRVGKARGSVTGLQRQERYESVTLSNGEHSLAEMTGDGGLKARVLTYFGSPWGGTTDRHRALATRTREGCEANHGHAARAFCAAIVGFDDAKRDEVRELHRALVQQFIERARAVYPDHPVAARLATYAAACEVAGSILSQVTGVLPHSAEWVTETVWRQCLERSTTADRATAALEELISWIGSNPDEWCSAGNTSATAPPRGWLGVVGRSQGGIDKLHIMANQFAAYIQARGFNLHTTLSTWADNGWIDVERSQTGRRFSVKRSVAGNPTRVVNLTAKGLAKLQELTDGHYSLAQVAPVQDGPDAAGWGY